MKVRKWIAAGALTAAALGATAGGLEAASAGAATTTSSSSSSSATLEGIICKIFPFLPFCHHHQSPPVSGTA